MTRPATQKNAPAPTEKIESCGWTLRLPPCSGLKMDDWLPRLDELRRDNGVKKNSKRAVFRVPASLAGKNIFVKTERLSGPAGFLKSLAKCNAELEYRSHRLLLDAGVPAVTYLGWGRRGVESMVFSEEWQGGRNAREYWFENFAEETKKRKFLSTLAGFVRNFLNTPLRHPDFHLGNLLYNEASSEFALVDVYGVSKSSRSRGRRAFELGRIFGALRGELDEDETAPLLSEAGLADGADSARRLWRKIVGAEDAEMEKLWPKRREQILRGNPKYCSVLLTESAEYRIRKSMSGRPLADEDMVKKGLFDMFEVVVLSRKECREAWLDSFKKEFMRRPSEKEVVMWELSGEKRDRLFFPRK